MLCREVGDRTNYEILFIEQLPKLESLPVHMVLTFPVSLHADQAQLRAAYANAVAIQIPMVRVRERGSHADDPVGIQALRDFLARRYEQALPLYRKVGDVLGEANCIQRLGTIALARSDHEAARARYEQALPLYRKVGDVLGEANCIQRLGDIALARLDHEAARDSFTEALALFSRIPESYSIGWVRRRLARISRTEAERDDHVAAFRAAWQSIDRPDLIESLDREFGPVVSS